MQTTLYIHCGVHRTGTTLIQGLMASNREYFRDKGILYPFDSTNHQDIVNKIKYKNIDLQKLSKHLRQISEVNNSAILLSGEDFCSIPQTSWLKELSKEFNIKVIFYLRRQDIWINSWYNQHVKWPWDRQLNTLDPAKFLERLGHFYWIDYSVTLGRWAEVIGKNNLMLGVVEKSQAGDIIPDFVEKLGLTRDDLPPYGDAHANRSVSPLALEALRREQILDLPADRRQKLVQRVATAADKMAPGMNNMIYSPAQRRGIIAKFKESNAAVASLYFRREDGQLFQDPDISDDDPFAHVSEELVKRLKEEVIMPFFEGDARQRAEQKQERVEGSSLARAGGQAAPSLPEGQPDPRVTAPSNISPGLAKVAPIAQVAPTPAKTPDNSEEIILRKVLGAFGVKSIVDFGTGKRHWLKTAVSMGIQDVQEYNIPETALSDLQTLEKTTFLTALSKPSALERKFDLAVSTEAAQHISYEHSLTFIKTICSLSDVVLFSAALPYQGGIGHVNENWVEYWAKLFTNFEYDCYDWLRLPMWHDIRIRSYYRQNIMMFVSRHKRADTVCRIGEPTSNPLSMIHPEQYIKSVNRSLHPSVKNNIRDTQQYSECVRKDALDLAANSSFYRYGREDLSYSSMQQKEARRDV